MSLVAIEKYYQKLDNTLLFGQTNNEQSIRNHFWSLINEYASKFHYEIVAEVSIDGTKGKKVRPDGTIKNRWGLTIGLWESKDTKDNLEEEINKKIEAGYPLVNILFENSEIAILFQNFSEIARVNIRDKKKLDKILTDFVSFKSEEVKSFEAAIEKFKIDVPIIVANLRKQIVEARETQKTFLEAHKTFFEICKTEINPHITLDDIREMMIQHILTSDIFERIFGDASFHRHNTVAAELEKLISVLFSYEDRKNLLHSIDSYYSEINKTAAAVQEHHEKQKLLKVVYENFYKVYNPKAADKLGVVYTPNEIVHFMVEATNILLHQHFYKTLADKDVEILDPATGTGTFICEIIDSAIPKHQLEYKFRNEIFANEVSILAYYIAHLNIEYTFMQKMDKYAEFPNLAFVDTLDNINALNYENKQLKVFALTEENTKRINRQNERKISVIIGNPPYNANQKNENENNKNRFYPEIAERIKNTFIKNSNAQKAKAYDMYVHFWRWAMDRIDKNGIISFITNRSFIDAKSFDGFRNAIQTEFSHCYIIDLGGNIRENFGKNTKIANVFDIQTGVAIMILVKREKHKGNCFINYFALPAEYTKEEKLDWLYSTKLEEVEFVNICPDDENYWVNLPDENDWQNFIPVCSKNNTEKSIFHLSSNGIVTARDEWVYDFNRENLENKVKFFCEFYESEMKRWNESDKTEKINNFIEYKIKWTRDLKNKLFRNKSLHFDSANIIESLYRPFVKRYLYFSKELNEVQYRMPKIFGKNGQFENIAIAFRCIAAEVNVVLAVNKTFDLAFLKLGNGVTFSFPLFRYDSEGKKIENIADFALQKFQEFYTNSEISKIDIFHYIYAVLHFPEYRKKYEKNLKRSFPRIPFYENFDKFANWGKELMDLHINFENVEPFSLLLETEHHKDKPLPKLKRVDNDIVIDDNTVLRNIPAVAWEYKLGNRSALEWVLSEYKEKNLSDETLSEQFDNYKFSDFKEKVVELLKKICTVSVKTMKILEEMKKI